MSKAIAVLALISVGASLGCMHLVRELRAERAEVQTLQTRIAELEAAIAAQADRTSIAAAAPTRLSPWSPPIAEPSTQTSAANSEGSTRSAPPSPPMPDEIRAHMKRQRELLQDPKYREAMRVQHRVHMDSAYPGLPEALGFTKEEADRFLDLLSQQQLDDMEHAQETMHWGPMDAESARATQQAMMERQQRQQTEMDAQFGPNTHQKWMDYQETLGQRHRVAAMQAQLAMTGAPLNADQSKAVLNALVEEQRRQMKEMSTANQVGAANALSGFFSPAQMDDPETYAKKQERSHERLVSSLQSTLTSEQLSHLETMLKRERDAQRASMELMRAQGVMNEHGVVAGAWSSAPGFVMHAAPMELQAEDAEQP